MAPSTMRALFGLRNGGILGKSVTRGARRLWETGNWTFKEFFTSPGAVFFFLNLALGYFRLAKAAESFHRAWEKMGLLLKLLLNF